MKRLWTEEEVEHRGKFYQVPRVKPSTRPVQKPHPPIWVAANGDSAIRRAARWGYPWLVNPHATVPTVAKQLALYRTELDRAHQPIPQVLPMMRELYLAQDQETAYLQAQRYLEGKYSAYSSWGQDKALPGEESFTMPFPDLARDRFLLGSPTQVVQEIRRYGDELGRQLPHLPVAMPGMDQERRCARSRSWAGKSYPRLRATSPEGEFSGCHPRRFELLHGLIRETPDFVASPRHSR